MHVFYKLKVKNTPANCAKTKYVVLKFLLNISVDKDIFKKKSKTSSTNEKKIKYSLRLVLVEHNWNFELNEDHFSSSQ